MNKRYLNIRPMFISFLGLMAGIGISFLFLTQKVSKPLAVVMAFGVVTIGIIMIIYAEYTKGYNQNFRARKNVSPLLKISGFLLMGSFVLGALLSAFPICKIMYVPDYYEKVEIRGTVSEYVLAQDRYVSFILTDCEANDNKLDFDVLVYTSPFAGIELGDNISATASLDSYLLTENYGLASLIEGVGYSAYIDLSSITITDNSATIKDKIRNETFDILSSRLSDDNADIMYSIIFGESGSIDKHIKSQFSYAGISHMLAVSGLHVSFLFSLIYFILKRCKINTKFSLVLMFCILLFYSYLCSFSPSVCRASIMTMVTLICSTFKFEYDGISSLSIAGIIILLASPLMFFSVSFRLSFLCVFAIITLAPFLTKLFKKCKLPKAFAETLAISISISVVTLPIMINTFEEVSLLGVITNIFVIPLFSVLYTLTLLIVLFSFILRPLSVFLYVPNLFLHLIRVIADYICKIPFAVFKVFNVGYLMIFGVAVVCVIINYLMTSAKSKVLISLSLVALICGYTFAEMQPAKYASDQLVVYYSGGDSLAYYLGEEGVTLIGSDFKRESLSHSIKDLRSYTIENIVAYDFTLNKLDDLVEICNYYEVKNVYLPKEYLDLGDVIGANLIEFVGSVQVGNLTARTLDYYTDLPLVHLSLGGTDTLIVGDLTTAEREFVANEFESVDYAITDKLERLNLDKMDVGKIILTKVSETSENNVLNLKLCGKIRLEVGV